MPAAGVLSFINIPGNTALLVEHIGFLNNISWHHSKTTTHLHIVGSSGVQQDFFDTDTFVVVRNPFARVLHEFNRLRLYHALGHRHATKHNISTSQLPSKTTVLRKVIENRSAFDHTALRGHFVEQWRFLPPKESSSYSSSVTHILRRECIMADFDSLMVRYGLPARWNSTEGAGSYDNRWAASYPELLSIEDFAADAALMALVRHTYARDFVEFNYSTDPAHAEELVHQAKYPRFLNYVHIAQSGGGALTRMPCPEIYWEQRLHVKEGDPDPWIDYRGFHRPMVERYSATEQRRFDWFTVVRNPFDVALSIFNFLLGEGSDTREALFDGLSRGLHNKTQALRALMNYSDFVNKVALDGRYRGLVLPQSATIANASVPVKVLRHESLQTEFDALMREYALAPRWVTRHAGLPFLDFPEMVRDPSLVAAVQAFYADDFSLFNYSTDPWASYRGQVAAGLLPRPALQAGGEAKAGSVTCEVEQS